MSDNASPAKNVTPLPCPFCGKEPIINRIGAGAPHVTCYDPRQNFGQCAASAWVTLEVWNRRASLPADPPKAGTPETFTDAELAAWVEQVKNMVFYARVAAREKGYALAVHGTLRRDVDVIAVPWSDEACDADELAQAVTEAFIRAEVSYEAAWDVAKPSREEKPFGRIAWSIPVKWKFHTGPPPYLDLSVAPKAIAQCVQQGAPTPPADPPKAGIDWQDDAKVMEVYKRIYRSWSGAVADSGGNRYATSVPGDLDELCSAVWLAAQGGTK